ncbi:hypothetical protein JVU11DRAFT_3232 [Chiua virens]|nr:hypothetical protein JVU11DRAFT_3232 [Chiua virens]
MTVAPRNGDTIDSGHLVEKANPFASTLFLPTEALLNRVTEQFLISHLVGRYPLIFGPWFKRLDLETHYFPSISHSIVEIMTRSKNQGFVLTCKRLLKTARIQHQFVLEASAAALSSCTEENASDTQQEEIDHAPAPPVLVDGEVLCESLEQLFRVGTPQRRFKPAATPQLVSLSQDDEDSLVESIPDERIDNEVSWIELPEIVTVLPDDHDQMLTEDVDVFAQEWPDDGIWCLLEADANVVDGLPATTEPQSEGSLIDTVISLAGITTRSPKASTPTLNHHQDVADPATSGSRYSDLQFTHLEDPGAWAPFKPSPSYAPHDCPENSEQVMRYLGTCQMYSESFESIDNSTEDAEIEDSDSILLTDVDITEFAGMEGDLDWLA